MLYFLYGTNTDKARAKAHTMLEALHKKRPEAEVFKVDSDSFSPASFEEFIGGQGLFERKFIVYGNRLFGNPEAKEFVLASAEDIAASDNVFILLEGKTDAAAIKKIEKQGAKVQKYGEDGPKKEDKDYSFTDAFAARDKKKLWVLYQKKMMAGEAPEMLHGSLFWQLKNLILAARCKSASEAGLHPFVYSKCKRAAAKWGEDKLLKTSRELVILYHEAHRGKYELDTALERFILGI